MNMTIRVVRTERLERADLAPMFPGNTGNGYQVAIDRQAALGAFVAGNAAQVVPTFGASDIIFNGEIRVTLPRRSQFYPR